MGNKKEYSLSQCARDVMGDIRKESVKGKVYHGFTIDSMIRIRFNRMNGYHTLALDSTTLRCFRKAKEEDNYLAWWRARMFDKNDTVLSDYGSCINGIREYFALECIDRKTSKFAFVKKPAKMYFEGGKN